MWLCCLWAKDAGDTNLAKRGLVSTRGGDNHDFAQPLTPVPARAGLSTNANNLGTIFWLRKRRARPYMRL